MQYYELIGIIATTLAALAIMGGFLVWIVRNIVREEISKATQQIQPGFYNGGESLADVSRKVNQIMDHLGLT